MLPLHGAYSSSSMVKAGKKLVPKRRTLCVCCHPDVLGPNPPLINSTVELSQNLVRPVVPMSWPLFVVFVIFTALVGDILVHLNV